MSNQSEWAERAANISSACWKDFLSARVEVSMEQVSRKPDYQELKPPQNVPNIYVLNKEGYQQEIKWAMNKMLEVYGVKEFLPMKSGNYRFTS